MQDMMLDASVVFTSLWSFLFSSEYTRIRPWFWKRGSELFIKFIQNERIED